MCSVWLVVLRVDSRYASEWCTGWVERRERLKEWRGGGGKRMCCGFEVLHLSMYLRCYSLCDLCACAVSIWRFTR